MPEEEGTYSVELGVTEEDQVAYGSGMVMGTLCSSIRGSAIGGVLKVKKQDGADVGDVGGKVGSRCFA